MKNEIDQTVERIGLLLDDKTICLIHFAEVEMRSDGYTATCSKLCDVVELKALAKAYTQLKADLATAKQDSDALRAEVEGLRSIISEALELGVFGLQDRSSISAPEDAYIRQLGEQIGFGALMDSASRMWRIVAIEKGLDGSEFTTGPCRAVREGWIARAYAAIKPNATSGAEGGGR